MKTHKRMVLLYLNGRNTRRSRKVRRIENLKKAVFTTKSRCQPGEVCFPAPSEA